MSTGHRKGVSMGTQSVATDGETFEVVHWTVTRLVGYVILRRWFPNKAGERFDVYRVPGNFRELYAKGGSLSEDLPPVEVINEGQRVAERTRTLWEAKVYIETDNGMEIEQAVARVAQMEASSLAHSQHLAMEQERLDPLINAIKQVVSSSTQVCMEQVGGGLTTVAIYPERAEAYAWIDDMDEGVRVGWYTGESEEDMGVMTYLFEGKSMDDPRTIEELARLFDACHRIFGS